jgi:hypothetical protein
MWLRPCSLVIVLMSISLGCSAQSRELEYGDYFGSLPNLDWAPPMDSIKLWKLKKVTAVLDADSLVFIFDRRSRLKKLKRYVGDSERMYYLNYDKKGNFKKIKIKEVSKTFKFASVEQFGFAYTKDGSTRITRTRTRSDSKESNIDSCDFLKSGDTLMSLDSEYFGTFWRAFQTCGDTLKETKRMPRWDHFHQKMDTAEMVIWHIRNSNDQLVSRQYKYIHYTSDCGVGMHDQEHWRYDAQGRLAQYEDVRIGYTVCYQIQYHERTSDIHILNCSASSTREQGMILEGMDYFWMDRVVGAPQRYYFQKR